MKRPSQLNNSVSLCKSILHGGICFNPFKQNRWLDVTQLDITVHSNI